MSVLVEFVGGHLDGRILELAEPYPTYYVHAARAGSVFVPAGREPELEEPAVYRRESRRTVDAPTGEPVYRYRLVT